ncbi:hypothetical protein MJO48_03020 [Dickeya fangzhongdai]|uniref:hypothetical protein n=1 Tax=Dickeya fangzhongdai TaxID=1778540 RepID=UPI001EFB485F|nr:hypothetical protein [Dickeya fangzhongdai]ULR31698.1 hypothetical protein MJO48_03020 [Dickeya fangzhongdai]
MERTLVIDIHFPSCKRKNITSESFEEALRDEFKNESYGVKFNFTSEGSGFFDYGHSYISYPSGASNEERDGIDKRIMSTFSDLTGNK